METKINKEISAELYEFLADIKHTNKEMLAHLRRIDYNSINVAKNTNSIHKTLNEELNGKSFNQETDFNDNLEKETFDTDMY